MSQLHSIGYEEWLEENVSNLAFDFYGKHQENADDLYYSDNDFKEYCQEAWSDCCDAYEAKQERF